jgi:hypothetical protein
MANGKDKNVYRPDPDKPAGKSKSEVIALYRETMLDADIENVEAVEDEQIWACVRGVPGSGDSVEAARLTALDALAKRVSASEDVLEDVTVSDVSITGAESKVASDLGHKISTTTQEHIRDVVAGVETVKRGPLVLRRDLLKDFGEDGVRGLPRPGTPKKLADGTTDTGGNNPDRFDVTRIVDGEHKTKKVSTYDMMWLATADGRRQVEERDAWRDSLKDKSESKYANEPLDVRQTNANKWAQRFTASVSVLKRAVRIEHLIAEIQDTLPNIRVEIKCKRDANNKLTDEPVNSTRPIYLSNADENVGAEPFSVGSFLLLKPKQANKENGGSVAALKITAKRATKGKAANAETIPDMATAENWFALLGQGLADANWASLLHKRLTPDTEDAKHYAYTLGNIYSELHVLFGPREKNFVGTFRKKFEDAQRAIDSAAQNEKTAKSKAA